MTPMECEQQWASAYGSYRKDQMRADVFVEKVDELCAELASANEASAEVSELDYRMRLSLVYALHNVDRSRAIETTLSLWEQHRRNPAAFPANELALPGTNPPTDRDGEVLTDRFDVLIPDLAYDAVFEPSISAARIEELITISQNYRRERGDSQREIDNVRIYAYQGMDRPERVLELIGDRRRLDVDRVATYQEALAWFLEYDILAMAHLETGDLVQANQLITEMEAAPIDVTSQPLMMIAESLEPLARHLSPDTTLRRVRRVLTDAVGVPSLQKPLLQAACVTAAGGLVDATLRLVHESEGHMRHPVELLDVLARVLSIAAGAGAGATVLPRFDAPRWRAVAEVGECTVAELARGFMAAATDYAARLDERNGTTRRVDSLARPYEVPDWKPEHFIGTGLDAAAPVDALGLRRLREDEAPSPWTVMDYLQMIGEEDEAQRIAHNLANPTGASLDGYVAAVPRFLDEDEDTGVQGALEMVALHDGLVDGTITDPVEGRASEVVGMVRAQMARRPEVFSDRHAVEIAALGLPTLLALDPSYCINRAAAILLKIAESFSLSANGMRQPDPLRRGIASFVASVAEDELSNPELRSELIIIAEALETESAHIDALATVSLAQTYLTDPALTGESVVGDATHEDMQLHLLTMKARNFRYANNTRESVRTYFAIIDVADRTKDVDLAVDARAQALGALLDNREFTKAANLWEDNRRWMDTLGDAFLTSHPGPRSTMAAAMLRTTVFMTDDAMDLYFPQAFEDYRRDAWDYLVQGSEDGSTPAEDRTRHIIGETSQIVGELVRMEHLRHAAEMAGWASSISPIDLSAEGHFLALTMQVPIHVARGDDRTAALLIETAAQQARDRGMTMWYNHAVNLLRIYREADRASGEPYRQALADLGEPAEG
ncbi:hypothetical protein [Corynebacterium guangdongense]|uniref:Uncharacterized protein n=1 Tax=Corynebacterium guangdongense TaxID=1783348 RepID=A0ABU1ZVZ2_9CORY|nr:hypothetical protein [Corynebacterium guangdongense]MDR7328407.1 hypothetical protein [Corynebacterium guangdongense]